MVEYLRLQKYMGSIESTCVYTGGLRVEAVHGTVNVLAARSAQTKAKAVNYH